jgi:glutamate racemase
MYRFLGKFGTEIKELICHKFLEKRERKKAQFSRKLYNINCCDGCTLYEFLSTKIEELFGTHFKVVCSAHKMR